MIAKKLVAKYVKKIERHTVESDMSVIDLIEVWGRLDAFNKLMSLGFSANLLDENHFAIEAKCTSARREPSTMFNHWEVITGEVEVTVTIFLDPVEWPF